MLCVYVVCCRVSLFVLRYYPVFRSLSLNVSVSFRHILRLNCTAQCGLHTVYYRSLSYTFSQPASHYTLTYIGSKKKKKTDTVNDNTSTITLGEKNVHRMLSDWIHSSFSRVSFVKRSGYTQSLRCAFSGSGRMMFREWKSSATTANILYEDWYFLCVRTDFGNFFGNRKFTWDHIKLVSC